MPAIRLSCLGAGRPALAFSFTSHTAYLAWKGADDDTRIYGSKLGPRDSGWHPLDVVAGVGTIDSPALVVFRGVPHVFWKGIEADNTLWFSTLGRQDEWRRNSRSPTRATRPAAVKCRSPSDPATARRPPHRATDCCSRGGKPG